MGVKNNNPAYILIAILSLIVFYQFTIVVSLKKQNSELDSRIQILEQTPTDPHLEELDELREEISKINQKLSEQEDDPPITPEDPPVYAPSIPQEWMNQTTLTPLNLTNLTLKDPFNNYLVSNNTLSWDQVNRTQNQGLVGTGYNLTHHIIDFDFQIDNFTFGTGGNRRLITFWALSDTEEVNDTRSYTMLYAEQVTYREGIYELIFHQKMNDENIWVDVGNVYDLNSSYHCRIFRYGDKAKYQIYSNSSKTVLLDESVQYELVEDDYQYLYLGYMYPPSKPNDLHITSSGRISNVRILGDVLTSPTTPISEEYSFNMDLLYTVNYTGLPENEDVKIYPENHTISGDRFHIVFENNRDDNLYWGSQWKAEKWVNGIWVYQSPTWGGWSEELRSVNAYDIRTNPENAFFGEGVYRITKKCWLTDNYDVDEERWNTEFTVTFYLFKVQNE